jgi:hypothetical protein
MKLTNKFHPLFCFLLSAFLLVAIVSCSKKDTPTPTPTPAPANTPFATINGSTEGSWKITCDTSAGSSNISISGSCNGYVVSLALVDVTDTGVYPLGILVNCQATVVYQGSTYEAGILNNGTLHVTSKNNTKKTISGTFNFGALGNNNATISVTNGVFTNLIW